MGLEGRGRPAAAHYPPINSSGRTECTDTSGRAFDVGVSDKLMVDSAGVVQVIAATCWTGLHLPNA